MLQEHRGRQMKRFEMLTKYYDHILDISGFLSTVIKKKELSKKSGLKLKFIKRLFDDFPNKITVKDLVKIADAIDMELDLSNIFVPKKLKDVRTYTSKKNGMHIKIDNKKNQKFIADYYAKNGLTDKSAEEKIAFIEREFGYEHCSANTIDGQLLSAEMVLLAECT